MKMVWRTSALVMLAGIAVHHAVAMHKPAGIVEYHARAREVAARVPSKIDAWVGEDVRVPVQAMTVLRPNVMISRRYVNVENGATAGVLLVHCADAHAMAGHFPLRCYPARGWNLVRSRPRDWQAGDLRVTGTEYEFTLDDQETRTTSNIVVANCLLRPGMILRDMDGMTRSILGAGGQALGAAQVQVYFDSAVSEAKRDEAIVALLKGYRPVIDAVVAGPTATTATNAAKAAN
jgi:hypothetical protein